MTQAKYSWKQYDASISISGLEERSNMGENRLIALLEAKIKQAEMSIRDRMSRDAFGDGTGNGSKNLTGLAALVSATSSVGGIDPATYTWWKSTVTSSAGSFAATGLDKMRTMFNTLSMGNDKPDFLITDQNVFEYFEKTLQPQERYTNTKAANTGFTTLSFKGVPLFFDRDCTSGYLYMLNSQYLNLYVHQNADLTTTEFLKPVNQDCKTSHILFQGNLTTNNRRKHGVITGITA